MNNYFYKKCVMTQIEGNSMKISLTNACSPPPTPSKGGQCAHTSSKGGQCALIPLLRGQGEVLTRLISFIIIVLCVLTACTKEEVVIPYSGNGKKVAVRFSLGDVEYNGSEEMMLRHRPEMASETIEIPLGDSLNMVMTLEVDHKIKQRAATSNLDAGMKLRVVAYQNGDTWHAQADYTVSNITTGGNRRELEGPTLEVDPGDYRFVAYSYHSDAPLHAHSETITDISPENDLLWGCFPHNGSLYHVSASSFEEVNITMSHHFSQMKIVATTENLPDSYTINGISNVSIAGKSADLTVHNGSLKPKDDVAAFFSSLWSGTNTKTITSEPRLIYTGGEASTIVKIGSLHLSGNKNFANLAASFNKKLQSGVSYTLRINFQRDYGIEGDHHLYLQQFMNLYAGAFWKANQTGERLIRVLYPASGINLNGTWTAQVIRGVDWIVLDQTMTSDPNVGWLPNANESNVHNGNDSYFGKSFDELHPVNSSQTKITGSSQFSANNPIYFRIGLRSQYIPTADRPARYGAVLITFAGGWKQRIWIRQGEGDDYLMTNNDPITATPDYKPSITTRTATRRFSPYNLTAKTLDTSVDISGAKPEVNPGIFTDYPSKAGAFFQWANNYTLGQFTGGIRWAFNPYKPTVPSWMSSATSKYWSSLMVDHETCPPGYRRPNDGSISGNENGTSISNSELRQSLFLHPQTGFNYASNLDNSVWGYYADGFFDRRLISNNHTAVAFGTDNVAYMGRLFYNSIPGSDHFCASLFLPSTGNRTPLKGDLVLSPFESFYWTSSSNGENNGIGLRIWNSHAGPWYIDKSTGLQIRCVRE